MTPSEIKVALERRKTSLADISRQLGVANASVTNVVRRRMNSARIESKIAELLEIPLYEIFPDRYPKPEGYQEPEMVEISTAELRQLRQNFAKATQIIDRLVAA